MSGRARRFFWGHTLAQAVAAAARWYGVEPGELAYRVREKRHGFIKVRRPVVLEVDPEAPRRPAGAAEESGTKAGGAEPVVARARAREERPPHPPRARPATQAVRPERPPRRATARREPEREHEPELWHAPDEEGALAVAEAARRLLRLAGLELEPRARLAGERLEIELCGPDETRLPALGLAFLDHLEHLLPRAARQLSGKLVRVRIEGAGLRAARERELRAEARQRAERVLATGHEELLGPLDPGERRVVHLELSERSGIVTESLGTGLYKRLRISPAPGGAPPQDNP